MIKDGMWFEDEEHYRFYLGRMKAYRECCDKAMADWLAPLFDAVRKIDNADL